MSATTPTGLPPGAAAVLDFWFRESTPAQWFKRDPAFDAAIRARFADTLARALRGELSAWRATPRGRLAAAFAGDPMALVLAQEAVAGGALAALDENGRTFLLMPYMHSESAVVHAEAERLFREHTPAGNHEYELRHKAIIDRFGRYPHRNAALGRESTPEEASFLTQPGSSF